MSLIEVSKHNRDEILTFGWYMYNERTWKDETLGQIRPNPLFPESVAPSMSSCLSFESWERRNFISRPFYVNDSRSKSDKKIDLSNQQLTISRCFKLRVRPPTRICVKSLDSWIDIISRCREFFRNSSKIAPLTLMFFKISFLREIILSDNLSGNSYWGKLRLIESSWRNSTLLFTTNSSLSSITFLRLYFK